MGERSTKRRKHRASYPTPGFYLFGFLLNLLALLVGGAFFYLNPTSMVLLGFGIVAAVGVLIAIYSSSIRPKESNKKLRKILVGFVAAYGTIVIVAIGATILLSPGPFISGLF